MPVARGPSFPRPRRSRAARCRLLALALLVSLAPATARSDQPATTTPGASEPITPREQAILLFKSVAKASIAGVQTSIAHGVDVNFREPQTGATPIMLAAAVGDTMIIADLIAAGADVNLHALNGMTALHAAAYKNQRDAAVELLNHGADATARDTTAMGTAEYARLGKSSACIALFQEIDRVAEFSGRGQRDSLHALIARGIPVGVPSSTRIVPLHAAAGNGYADVVRDLLAAGARVDQPDSSGVTALHQAARRGQAAVVKLLLAAGADRAHKSAAGFTALDAAKQANHPEVVLLLQRAPAK
jgi:ankyrin repeat protein